MGRGGGQFPSAVPYASVYVLHSLCVCMVHMCISAGGVEQGVVPDGHTQTHTEMTDSTH